MTESTFSASAALAPLKQFQRRTVDLVFDRLYGGDQPARRFLVADEVGLGKTMVARGVIARMIEHLSERHAQNIDIIYICSSQAISSQNLVRLNVVGKQAQIESTRMTLLALRDHPAGERTHQRVRFISLTPGTTFKLHAGGGLAKERALLLNLLRMLRCEQLPTKSLKRLLQLHAGDVGWDANIAFVRKARIDKQIARLFLHNLRNDAEPSRPGKPTLITQIRNTCERLTAGSDLKDLDINHLIAQLRLMLARSSIGALKPDLLILDEFQRFAEMLGGNSEMAKLANALFNYCGEQGGTARTLLLSATPYRMLTVAGDDPSQGNHYSDFLKTISFLYGEEQGPSIAKALETELANFRTQLRNLPQSRREATEARNTVQNTLRRVISRTERVNNTAQRDSMVSELALHCPLDKDDLLEAVHAHRIARALDAPGIIEYWKSAPWMLNFMRGYKLKESLRKVKDKPSAALLTAIADASPSLLQQSTIQNYAPIAPTNARMRALKDLVFGSNESSTHSLHRHLWLPPAMPYYGTNPPGEPLTKSLVFSSWSMAPDAIAATLSYEAERLVNLDGGDYFNAKPVRPLQFKRSGTRLDSLRNLLLLYPSHTLAELIDPLRIRNTAGGVLSTADMLQHVRTQIQTLLNSAGAASSALSDVHEDVHVWNLSTILDQKRTGSTLAWILDKHEGMLSIGSKEDDETGAGEAESASSNAFQEHVRELAETTQAAANGVLTANEDDLVLLTELALGSPAVCTLRALKRIAPDLTWHDATLKTAAAKVAWAFRTLFNQRDSVALLRNNASKKGDDTYWRLVLEHCRDHQLQAVLDEFAHYLVDAKGLLDLPERDRVKGVAEAMSAALTVRASSIEVDNIAVVNQRIAINKFHIRGRFAMRLADSKDEDGNAERISGVRDAFNSPFRPFVLASTSVGQEGLDFHPYCYRVVHWNLPSNPVDMEQREGRVHRYKGHAVRLNVADQQATKVHTAVNFTDPWRLMFDAARSETKIDSDLVPYWICEGKVKVQRCVPMPAYSKEVAQLGALKRSLAIYRLAFGQPRQEDLLNWLQQLSDDNAISSEVLDALQIDLQPPAPASQT